MKVRISGVLASFAVLLAGLASASRAAPVPAQVDLTALRAVQVYGMDRDVPDDVYLLVSGVAKGEEVQTRLPKEGTMQAGPKKPPVTDKQPLTLWKGELAEGEFAFLTVTLFHGKGADAAKVKEYADKSLAAEKAVAERAKKTLTADDAKKLTGDTLKAQQEMVKKIKDTLSREKNTDHFGGQFNLLVWNDAGKLRKRLDPVGLTFGEHYGTDVKIYSKLKFTRSNVFYQDEDGEWYEEQLGPVSDEKDTARVKMLETEYVKNAEGLTLKHVTDYLADLQVKGAGGKPELWNLGGEKFGPGPLHTYWEFAE